MRALLRLFSAALLAAACSPAATDLAEAPQRPATSAASGARAKPKRNCGPAVERLLLELDALWSEGRLDRALKLSEPGEDECIDGSTRVAVSRLELLQRARVPGGAVELARRIQRAPDATPQARALAGRVIANPPSYGDDAVLAESLLARARTEPDADERRALFDAALLAYERARGRPEPVALVSPAPVYFVDDRTLLTTVRVEPRDETGVVLLTRADASASQLRVQRLYQTGEVSFSANRRGQVVVAAKDRALGFESPTAQGRRLPPASRYDVLADGVVVLSRPGRPGHVELVDIGGERSTGALAVALGPDGDVVAQRTRDERYWVVCSGSDAEDDGVVVVDGRERRVTVSEPEGGRCALDEKGEQVVVFRKAVGPAPAQLELHPLDGSASKTLRLPGARENTWPTIPERVRTLYVQRAQGGYWVDLDRRRLGPPVGFGKHPGPPQLRHVPVGSMGDTPEDIRALRPLAVPPRQLVQPHFAKLQVWNTNGMISFDGKTVAAYTEGPDYGQIRLVIADAKGLKVRHRIDVQYGNNWLAGFFLTSRLLVAQSYPEFKLYDAYSGEQLAVADEREAFVTYGERYVYVRGQLFQVPEKRSEPPFELSLGGTSAARFRGKAPERELDVKPGAANPLRFDGTDTVVVNGDAPSWLHCRFGEVLAPFEVCRHRVAK